MSNVFDAISFRTMSGWALSVGTGLAFESLFPTTTDRIDPARKPPATVDFSQYTHFYINVATLFRNIYQALSSDTAASIKAEQYYNTLLFEINIIEELFSAHAPTIQIVYYVCEYKAVYGSNSPFIAKKGDHTPKQLAYRTLMVSVLKKFLANKELKPKTKLYDSSLGDIALSITQSVLIMTHIAYDLFSYGNFFKLDLLESHTGVVKDKSLYYTKFTDGKDLPTIPFHKGMMAIFGDNEHFRSLDKKLRDAIVAISIERKWTQKTTKDKVLFDLALLKNKYYDDVIRSIYRSL